MKTEYLHDENNLIEYNNDYFKIVTIAEEHNSDNMLMVSCECEHISYDLIEEKRPYYLQLNKSAIYIMNDLLTGTGFQFLGTDVLTTASIDIQKEADIKSLLYLVATIWQGELKYFRDTIELKQTLGANRGADFRFRKNLKHLKRLIDRVESTVSYEVEVVQGTELEELGYFELGDTMRVVDDMLKIELDTRIVELEKDLVTGLNSRVILGQPIQDLSANFASISTSINQVKQTVAELELTGVSTFYQTDEPLTASAGDLWFKIDTYNVDNILTEVDLLEMLVANLDTIKKLYRYNGAEWQIFEDSDYKNVIDEHGNLIAERLTGALNTAIAKVQNSTGKVTFDDRGIIAHDQPIESESVKAVLLTADGILIANAKDGLGTWIWRTAITADGISADEINTGTLTAININGVTITGSTLTSETATQRATIAGGSMELYDKVNSKALLTTENGAIKMLGSLQTGTELGSAVLDNQGLQFYDEVGGFHSSISSGFVDSLNLSYLLLSADTKNSFKCYNYRVWLSKCGICIRRCIVC